MTERPPGLQQRNAPYVEPGHVYALDMLFDRSFLVLEGPERKKDFEEG